MDIRSIVGIFARDGSKSKYSGTGFFVAGGLILTCAHVVDDAYQMNGKLRFRIEGQERFYNAEVIFKSEASELDIAILKPVNLPEPAPALPLITSRQSDGHNFNSFGYPLESGGQGLYADGKIHNWVRDLHERDALQISSNKITHGFSGCPVWDEAAGGVVGMVSSGFDFGLDKKLGEVAFAIPSETLKDAFPELQVAPARIQPANIQPATFQPSLHQLPAPPADFVGRAEQLAQILRQERTAISGLGGVGKTALGLVAAWQLAESYPDAQFFIDLRGASPNPLAPDEALRQLIRACEPTADLRPYDEAGLQALYRSLLNGKRALLFLDNARHAAQVRPLLPPPGCGVLVTSRAHFTLPGMNAPLRLDTLPEPEAVLLITQISPRTTQHATSIAKLCACLPLALRIAATFLSEHPDWTPAEYIERLQKQRLKTLKTDGDPAQDVEAVFELSYALLAAEEQQQWRALSVFSAPFTRAALAAICALEPDPARDLAGKLHRMSLLEFLPSPASGRGAGGEGEGHYFLHDLLRDFAAARLDEKETFDAHRQHAEFFMQVAEQANDLYLEGGENLLRGLALFDSEWAHIQAAQAWAADNLENGAAELAMDFPNAGVYILELRLTARQRINWLDIALKATRKLNCKDKEGVRLGNLGVAYENLGEMHHAIKFYEQALVIAQEIGDRQNEGSWLGNLGAAYEYFGEMHRAIEFHEQALVIAQEIGDKHGEGNALCNLGLAYADLGETRRAIEFYEQSLVIKREIGDRRGEGNVLGNLGNAHFILGKARHAIEFFEQQLIIAREICDKRGEGNALGNLGNAYADFGETHRAIQFYEQHLVSAREICDKRGEGIAMNNLGLAYTALGETRRAIEFYEQRLVIAHETGNRRGEGTALFNMGLAYQKLGDLAHARQLGQQTLEIFVAIEDPHAPMVKEWLEGLAKE